MRRPWSPFFLALAVVHLEHDALERLRFEDAAPDPHLLDEVVLRRDPLLQALLDVDAERRRLATVIPDRLRDAEGPVDLLGPQHVRLDESYRFQDFRK